MSTRPIQVISYSFSRDPASVSIERKQRKINQWLRYHPEYRVTLSFCDLFGCLRIKIERDGEYLKSWIGDTLEKRLDEVISFLKIDGET